MVGLKKIFYLGLGFLLIAGLVAAIGGAFQDYSFTSVFEGRQKDGETIGNATVSDKEMKLNNFGGKGTGTLGELYSMGIVNTGEIDVISAENWDYKRHPLFRVVGTTNRDFMRLSVGEVYRDGAWHPLENIRWLDYNGTKILPNVDGSVEYQLENVTIDPLVPTTGFIPSFSHTTSIDNLGNIWYSPEQRTFFREYSFDDPYEVRYRVHNYSEQRLRQAEAEENRSYLKLDNDVTDRTKSLARRIVGDMESPYRKAEAIEEYLEENYTYARHYDRSPPGWDPIDWFLFEERKNDCTGFNSAFAVMARAVGVPARVVLGFSNLEGDSDNQIVYTDQAHLRSEILLENHGWIPFDATPSRYVTPQDTDNDEMPDYWENRYGLDFLDPGDAYEDPDGDGFTNVREYRAETSPRDRLSNPLVKKWGSLEVEVRDVSGEVIKGRSVEVHGRVHVSFPQANIYEVWGIDDLPVKIYLKENKQGDGYLTGTGRTTDNGYFDITCGISRSMEVGDYHLVAFTPGNDSFDNAWSDPIVSVISDTRMSLSLPERHDIDQRLRFSGKLEEDSGKSISDEPITVSIEELGKGTQDRYDSNMVSTYYTDESGKFSGIYGFEVPGDFEVKAQFEGSDYYMESKAIDGLRVAETSLNILTENIFMRGSWVELEGSAAFGGKYMEDERIEIRFENENFTTETNENGIFSSSYNLPENVGLGLTLINYSIPSLDVEKLQLVKIRAPTDLDLSVPESAGYGKLVEVEGRLRKENGDPLSGQNVTLSTSLPENRIYSGTTDSKGKVSFYLSVPENERQKKANITLRFGSTDKYSSSRVTKSMNLGEKDENLFFWFAVAILAALGFGTFYSLRGKNLLGYLNDTGSDMGAKSGGRGDKSFEDIQINLPGMDGDLSDIWGVGDDLMIDVDCRGIDGGEGDELEIFVNGEEIYSTKFEGQDKISLKHKFLERGPMNLEAKLSGVAADSTEIRIVDYSEEVVEEYDKILKWLAQRGIEVGNEMTPRENYQKIMNFTDDQNHHIFDLIKNFEFAKYSDYDIGRKKAIRAIRARKKLEDKFE